MSYHRHPVLSIFRLNFSQAASHTAEAMGWFARRAFQVTLKAVDNAQEAVENYLVKELTYTGQRNGLVELAELARDVSDVDDRVKGRFGFAVDVSTPGWKFLSKSFIGTDAHAGTFRR